MYESSTPVDAKAMWVCQEKGFRIDQSKWTIRAEKDNLTPSIALHSIIHIFPCKASLSPQALQTLYQTGFARLIYAAGHDRAI